MNDLALQADLKPQSDVRQEQELNGGKLFGQLDDKARNQFVDVFFAFAKPNITTAQDEDLFDGAIDQSALNDIMRWLCQHSSHDEVEKHIASLQDSDAAYSPAVVKFRRDSFTRAGQTFVDVGNDDFKMQRFGVQIGGADRLIQLKRLLVLYANIKLISKLTEFANMEREGVFERHFAGICNGLETIPAHLHALIMFQVARKCASPLAYVNGVVRAAGTSNPAAMAANGLDLPLKALMAHSKELVAQVEGINGVFFDADEVCTKIERFHKISQAFMIGIDLPAKGELISQLHAQAGQLSRWIEPIIKNASSLIIRALKLPKNEAQDSIDKELILEAKSSMFVLETVRRCRDSLATNVLFAKVWKEVADILEPLTQRSLSHFRDNPIKDGPAQARLDASIALSRLRFGEDFGQIYIEARDMILTGQKKRA